MADQPKAVQEWTPGDVEVFLRGLDLPSLVPSFKTNAVNGADLLVLSDDDFMRDLGCTQLQVGASALDAHFAILSHGFLLFGADPQDQERCVRPDSGTCSCGSHRHC